MEKLASQRNCQQVSQFYKYLAQISFNVFQKVIFPLMVNITGK